MKLISHLLRIVPIVLTFLLISAGCQKTDSNTAPQVKISNLVDGKVYLPGEEILVNVAASDKEGDLKEVRLYINDVLKYTVTSAPYDIIWKTWGNDPGDYSLKAVAVDKTGKTSENTVKIYLKKGVILNNLLYDLDIGYLVYYGKAGSTSYSFNVVLYSNSVIPTNSGNGLTIGYFSASSADLAAATYSFDVTSTKSLNTFNSSDYFINCDKTTKIGMASGKIGEGYSYVDKSGINYKVFITGKNTFNEPIKAYFSGNLTYENKSK